MVENIKKQLGAFYTPIHTVNYMLSKMDSFDKNSKLLEPCGGDGVFVSSILEKKVLRPEQILVWDINPEIKNTIKNLGVNIETKDTLIGTDFDDNLFSRQKNFSHIIGNPPYLNKQSSYIKKNKNILKKIYKEIGANDTYAMFLYLCGRLLEPNGQLSFIISDTYLTLGIHKKLRHWLLENFSIKEITICPDSLFNDLGASVRTSIITIIKKKPDTNHFVNFNDCKNNKLKDYDGKIYKVNQKDFLSYPDFIFNYKNKKSFIQKIARIPKMINCLDGGLGMHTTNNGAFLGIINYDNDKSLQGTKKIKNVVALEEIKRGEWKVYHKRGGNVKYYSRPKHCIRWDSKSIPYYKGLKNFNLNDTRQGFLVSGVCSELSARMASKNVLWESNKAMCFYPKDSNRYPSYFFIGLLNSKIYNNLIKIFNHTNSIQIRDIRKLPFFDFHKEDIKKISEISKSIIKNLKFNLNYNFNIEQKTIDSIIKKYI